MSLHDALSYSVIFLLFCIPLGPTMKSVGIAIALIALLMLPACRHELTFVYSRSFSVTAALIFGMTLLSCMWSIADHHHQFAMIEKYMKLLLLPIFALGFQNKEIREASIQAFLLGMWITCIISFYKLYILHSGDAADVFNNHILTGFMMAFAAYLAGNLWVRRSQKIWRWVYGITVLAFSFQVLFVNTSRTGYIIYALLLVFFFIQFFSVKLIRYIILLGILGIAGITYFNTQSNLVQRSQDVVRHWHQYQNGKKNTGTGIRLQFHEYAKSLFLARPILGHGIGSFYERFHLDNPIPSWGGPPDPHSQFWLTASEFGLVGLLLLAGFLVNLFLISLHLQEMRCVLQALIMIFTVGGFSEGLLVNSGAGYLFIIFSALCIGEYIEYYHPKEQLDEAYAT